MRLTTKKQQSPSTTPTHPHQATTPQHTKTLLPHQYEPAIKNPTKTKPPSIPTTHTQDPIIYVTTLPHRGGVGPPPYKGVATTTNTRHNSNKNETSQPTPRRESGVRGVGSL